MLIWLAQGAGKATENWGGDRADGRWATLGNQREEAADI